MKLRVFFIFLIVASLPPMHSTIAFAESELAPKITNSQKCSQAYSAFIQASKKNTLGNIGSALKRAPRKTYNFMFANTINDYKTAWKEGSKIGRPARIMKRFFWAPRVRPEKAEKVTTALKKTLGRDPTAEEIAAKIKNTREEELKKFQWLTTLNEPTMDGAIELTSKLKQKYGTKIGLSARPFEGNLSLPGGIVAYTAVGGVIGFNGTWATATEKIKDYFLQKKLNEYDEATKKDQIGTNYLADWEAMGIISAEQKINILSQNAQMINDWGINLNSTDAHRPLPPRFYQFQMEGLLKTPQELNEFEDIALYALVEAQKRASKDPKIQEDSEIKKIILEKMNSSKTFSKKPEAQKNMLLMAFEPPIFLDGSSDDFSWYRDLVTGKPSTYLDTKRRTSDLYWNSELSQNKTDPKIQAIKAAYGNSFKVDPPTLLFTAMNFAPENADAISQKVTQASQADWFPKAQLPSVERLDHPENTYGEIDFKTDGDKEKKLSTEMDYLELWNKHPFFFEKIKNWKSTSTPMTIDEFSSLKSDTADLAMFNSVIQIEKEAKKNQDAPLPDPDLQEFCFLQKNTAILHKYAEQSSAGSDLPFCTYLTTMAIWRISDVAQKDYLNPKYGGEKIAATKEKLLKQASEKCKDPNFQSEFSKNAGLGYSDLLGRLSCAETDAPK